MGDRVREAGEIAVRVVEQPGQPSPSMLGPIFTGIAIALIPACVGYGIAFLNDLRKSDLEFTNRQIEKLYGPLYALTQANEATWKQFTTTEMTGSAYFSFDRPLTPEKTTIWRTWMKTVFQPLNLKIEDTIQNNAQLIAGDQMPQLFRQVIAHTEAYKGIMATWKDGDEKLSDYGAIQRNVVVGLNYPDKIVDCARDTYLALKKHQQEFQYKYVVYLHSGSKVESPPTCG